MVTLNVLSLSDYIVLGAMLLFSLGVGIYHGLNSKSKQRSEKHDQDGVHQPEVADEVGGRGVLEYFLAGRTMSLIPVALSFFATASSTLAVTGPAMEVYGFGLSYCWFAFTYILVAWLMANVFVPLFYKMGSINIYMFLELRYNRRMKEVITVLVTIRSVFFGSAVMYGTSVAFAEITNIDMWIIIGTLTGVCVIYTSLGGIRGVMWVDAFQGIMMVGSAVILIVIGIYNVGGLTKVWDSNYDTGRLDIFVFDLDLTLRHTFWSDNLGMFVVVTSYFATSQPIIHRLLTAPSVEVAKRSAYLGFFFQSLMILISGVIGLIMYAEFYECDPLTSKSVQNMNQLVPKFVAQVLGPYPVLPGLLFAGILSACLSTLSSIFNSMAAIIMETFIQPHFPKSSAKHGTNICRLLGLSAGILNTLCILIIELFPNTVQAGISSSACLDGPLLGLLVVGILAPQAKLKVVFTAFLGGLLATLWIVVGGLVINKPLEMKPMFAHGCFNETQFLTGQNISQLMYSSMKNSEVVWQSESPLIKYFPFHDVTFQWLALIGICVLCILLVVLSALFGADERSRLTFDPLALIPKNVQRLHQRLPKTFRRFLLCDVYDQPSKGELP